jgi:uncharacterized repeat protein (TIGR03803 family)
MARSEQHRNSGIARLAGTAGLLILLVSAIAAQAQTFQVIHNFTGGADGFYPSTGVVLDRAGNLYGGTSHGGTYTSSCNYLGYQTGCGVVYKMSHHGSGWIFSLLSSFDGANGYVPGQNITVAPDGSLYSTTIYGGSGDCNNFYPGCGTVFHLQPPETFCHSVSCPWTIQDLYQFQAFSDGAFPQGGNLTFDSAGNIYGTTYVGGLYDAGTLYELSPTENGWTKSVLYNFSGSNDGGEPAGGVVFDNAGNLYGVTYLGGFEGYGGVVYQLTHAESGWTETVIHTFQPQTDGSEPLGNLVMDGSGNLYGTTTQNGPNGGGTVWELSPGNGGWSFSVLYSFTGAAGPSSGLLIDGSGNLYGAAAENGAHERGSVFKLSPSNGGWSYADLYDFTGGSDGGFPGSVSMDSAGNLFGAAGVGGSSQNCPSGCGVVWEITP